MPKISFSGSFRVGMVSAKENDKIYIRKFKAPKYEGLLRIIQR